MNKLSLSRLDKMAYLKAIIVGKLTRPGIEHTNVTRGAGNLESLAYIAH